MQMRFLHTDAPTKMQKVFVQPNSNVKISSSQNATQVCPCAQVAINLTIAHTGNNSYMSPLIHHNQKIEIKAGKTLFQYAYELSMRVPSSCAQSGECHECIVEVVNGSGALSAITDNESFLNNGSYRLACQACIVNPDADIEFNVLRRQMQMLTDSINNHAPLSPLTTESNSCVEFNDPPINRKLGSYTGRILGIAADIGATSVALNLVDLQTGEVIYTSSFENPQRFGGSDILRRICYDATKHKGELQAVMLSAINFEIGEMVRALKIRRRQIYEIVVVGNTTMRDMFFGLDVQSIGVKPYRSITEYEAQEGKRKNTSIQTTAKELGLRIHPDANVYGAPLIGSHVGSDTSACIIATDLDKSQQPSILLDIGTNTEVVVGNASKMFAASCPAGPAFEGGQVRYAMPGYTGAISELEITEKGINYKVIGDTQPTGICGSGLIDLLAALRRTDNMDALGRFKHSNTNFKFEPTKGFNISRSDVSILAQAKSANSCGQSIVISEYGIPQKNFDKLYLAGGFANYISAKNAIDIGFIIEFPLESIVKVGNASLLGATMMLISKNCRRRAENLAKKVKHIELETSRDFFDFFVEGCQFKPMAWPKIKINN